MSNMESRVRSELSGDEEELIRRMEAYRKQYGDAETGDNVGYARQRAQEQIERRLNEAAGVDFEELDALAELGDIHVYKRTVEYDGKKIPVYVLRYGYPVCFFQSAIDYRQTKGSGWTGGHEISDQLIGDPSLWAKNKKELEEKIALTSTSKSGGMGSTISANYVNAADRISRGMQLPTSCGYAWNSVPPSSVIAAKPHDAGVSHLAGDQKTTVDAFDASSIASIMNPANDGSESHASYNEVAWSRYDKQGEPRLPDFITTKSQGEKGQADDYGKINEIALRHAAYHNVPIVIVDYRTYDDQEKIDAYEKKKSAEGLSSDEQDDYDTLLFLKEHNVLGKQDRRTVIDELERGRRIEKYEGLMAERDLTEQEWDDYDMLSFFGDIRGPERDKAIGLSRQIRSSYQEKTQDIFGPLSNEKNPDATLKFRKAIIDFVKLAIDKRREYWKKKENVDITSYEVTVSPSLLDRNAPLREALLNLVARVDELGLERMAGDGNRTH